MHIDASTFTAVARDRFWAKVVIGHADACWPWTGAADGCGYGRFHIPGTKNRTALAHRIAYILTNGAVPGDVDVLHECDNPPCCNPSHLREGTALDNVRDCIAKDRFYTGSTPGSLNGNSKLTEADVMEIRRRVAQGELRRDVGADYGMSGGNIGKICLRQLWKHVP